MGWALVSDTIPIYPLYALLFADAGLSGAEISSLFLLWSVVGSVAEVPSGALADRFSRRSALVASGLLQAAAYVLWTAVGTYAGFAAGFVLWGVSGALASGALEAVLYDGLAASGAEKHYPRVYGQVTAAGHLSQIPTAVAATVLVSTGGYALVGWASVASCLVAAAIGMRIPDRRNGAADAREARYFGVLRAGIGEVARRPAVRGAVLAVALLWGLDGLEEYFSLLARGWGIGAATVPLALLAIPLAGAAGSALAGRRSRTRPGWLAALMVGAVAVFGATVWLDRPGGVLLIALSYGMYHFVLVVIDTRLQDLIEGTARATVTSMASLGRELSAVALYVALALGQPLVVAGGALLISAALPRLLGAPRQSTPLRQPAG